MSIPPPLLCRLTFIATLYFSTLAYCQSAPASAPSLDCNSELLNLAPCLTYVMEGSNLTRPEKGCCPALASLVDAQPICLCQLLSNADSFGIQIDITRGLMLPTACRIDTPPITMCSAIGIPVASPVAPAPGPTGGQLDVPGPTPSALSGVPTGAKNGSARMKASNISLFAYLLCVGATVAAF